MKVLSALLLLVLMSVCISLAAFDGKIVCTKARNIQDQWTGILPGRPPVMPLCLQVVRQEPFSVNVFFSNPAIKAGKVHVTGTLKMQNPAGKTTFETPLKPQIFSCKNTKSIFLFPDYILVSFDPPDTVGEYVFTAELKDENTGTAFTAKASIRLEEKVSFRLDKKPLASLKNYYRNPVPQNILPAFNDFLKTLPAFKKKQGKNFNPLPGLSLFFFLLQENPQLHSDFAKLVDELQNPEEQFLGVIILHELGEKTFSLLSKKAQSRWNPRLTGTFRITKITAPCQLDVLWSEFFATGKKVPLARIVGEVKKIQGNISLDNYKKLKQPTKKDRESLMRFLNGLAASWSLGSNAKQHQLVAFYLEAMLSRKEINDPFTNAVIARKLKNINQAQK